MDAFVKSLIGSCGVTVIASGADFRTALPRIECAFRPGDGGFNAHESFLDCLQRRAPIQVLFVTTPGRRANTLFVVKA